MAILTKKIQSVEEENYHYYMSLQDKEDENLKLLSTINSLEQISTNKRVYHSTHVWCNPISSSASAAAGSRT